MFGPDSPAQEAPPIEPGTVLQSSFCLDRLLGQGSVGVVYLAHDLTLERDVAIKEPHRHGIDKKHPLPGETNHATVRIQLQQLLVM